MLAKFLKPMLPTLAETLPAGENWLYEVKFDGFRCLLYWDEDVIVMTSRNGHPLHDIFPEVPAFLKTIQNKVQPYLPLLLDGELCILENSFKASFEQIQKRGRLKVRDKINDASTSYPSSYCVFDLLAMKDQFIYSKPFYKRKEMLSNLCEEMDIKNNKVTASSPIHFIGYYNGLSVIEEIVKTHRCEGIVAKKKNSKWSPGVRTNQWIKVKNLKFGTFILLGFDSENGFFHVGAVKGSTVVFTGLFAHGISPQEKEALIQIVKNNESGRSGSFIAIEPSICVELSYLELYKDQLRQPRFSRFRFDADWEDCTWESLQKNN
jgi:DNA ligase D-like protein (predicted ligase)